MTIALLFPGQGLQNPSMLPWLEFCPEARPILDRLASVSGRDWRARLADPAWASTNAQAQWVVTATSLAAHAVLRPRLERSAVRVVAIAGYSVGELAAFSAAGVFEAAEALDLATMRAAAMDRSSVGFDDGLMALSGYVPQTLDALCAEASVEVAIELAPDRCVVGGSMAALNALAVVAAERGWQASMLRVRVASHTSRMLPAMAEFAAAIDAASPDWRAPFAPLVTGFQGTSTRSLPELRVALSAQLANTVRWASVMESIAERRPDCVLEVGGGQALARLWNSNHPEIVARSADEFSGADEIEHWISNASMR